MFENVPTSNVRRNKYKSVFADVNSKDLLWFLS
jgi:hypothetical protein